MKPLLDVPFFKPSIGPGEIAEVIETLRSGWLTTGPKTKRFELEFGRYIQQEHAVALNSCTAALHLALEAIGLKGDQAVLVPTMTFAATAEVVRYFGAHPILVDCREVDFNIDVADADCRTVEALRRNKKVVAIIPVHYGGQIGDTAGIRSLARKYSLKVIEDAAHCCPAFFKDEAETGMDENVVQGKAVGQNDCEMMNGCGAQLDTGHSKSWKAVGADADITCFSFYANKCITTGEGGMACTNSEVYAERMRVMSLHGISKDAWKRFTSEGSWYYEIVAPGFKYNMTDIAAALGIHQLRRADELHQKRRDTAALYTRLLGGVDELILPYEVPRRIHSWHLYAIRLKLDKLNADRAQIIQQMKERGIGASVHWMPLHMHPYYREKYGYKVEDFRIASGLYPQLITLPIYPDMKQMEVEYVCENLRSIIAQNLKPASLLNSNVRTHTKETKDMGKE